MAEQEKTGEATPEPRGLGEHTRGLAGEYAHEQGWGLNEAERTALPEGRQLTYGGKEYDYSARDFGDEPTDMTGAEGGKADELEKYVEEVLGGLTQGIGAEESRNNSTQNTTPNSSSNEKE